MSNLEIAFWTVAWVFIGFGLGVGWCAYRLTSGLRRKL